MSLKLLFYLSYIYVFGFGLLFLILRVDYASIRHDVSDRWGENLTEYHLIVMYSVPLESYLKNHTYIIKQPYCSYSFEMVCVRVSPLEFDRLNLGQFRSWTSAYLGSTQFDPTLLYSSWLCLVQVHLAQLDSTWLG